MSSSKRKSETGSEGTAPPQAKKVHPMFAPVAAVSKFGNKFKWYPRLSNKAGESSCLHGTYGIPVPSTKIAAFDIDGTLIKVKSLSKNGLINKFPTSSTDWIIWNTVVKEKLHQIHEEGYTVVLFSNQAYQGAKLKWFEDKLRSVAAEINLPLRAFAANLKDEFRKPGTGMFETFCRDYNGGLKPDMESSFFVGDAAGRPGDHSSDDKNMAKAAGLTFKTPEQFFLSE